ncbi:hypothetical protein QYE76_040354 [Lolium multiflorum]|uniref:RNase H type-1 domain-containing protein n=1 Tax=Lolium multiflorum TaxID=4521 RepID=A0AAD8TBK3_LOLMU|nr:hypothetical protein QYE76_040354 [Lolium multiflorum]
MDEDDNSLDPKAGFAGKSNLFEKKSVGAYHTFLGTPTVHATKSAIRILNATVPAVPQYVSPRIDGYDFSKCIMDGGASLNIMYLETLERMNLTKEQLKHSNTEFHGVVPELLPRHLRPTYHKFHARACYIYNKLKIPGPNGMITISGDYKKAHECELGEAAFAESVISGEELKSYRAAVDPIEMQTTKKQISEHKNSFKAAIETKKVNFKEGDDSKQPSDMSGVPRELAEHYLNINPGLNRLDRSSGYEFGAGTRNMGYALRWIQAASRLRSRSHLKSTGEKGRYVLQIHFEATNNMAEYEALLHGLRIAKEIGIKHIICCGDPDLVAQQVAGTWNARNSVMAAYRDEVDEIAKYFLGYEVKYVRRDYNTAADMLSKLGSARKPIPPGIFLEHLRIPSVKGANPENPEVVVSPAREVMAIIPAWTQLFLDYLIDQKLTEDEVLARQII